MKGHGNTRVSDSVFPVSRVLKPAPWGQNPRGVSEQRQRRPSRPGFCGECRVPGGEDPRRRLSSLAAPFRPRHKAAGRPHGKQRKNGTERPAPEPRLPCVTVGQPVELRTPHRGHEPHLPGALLFLPCLRLVSRPAQRSPLGP